MQIRYITILDLCHDMNHMIHISFLDRTYSILCPTHATRTSYLTIFFSFVVVIHPPNPVWHYYYYNYLTITLQTTRVQYRILYDKRNQAFGLFFSLSHNTLTHISAVSFHVTVEIFLLLLHRATAGSEVSNSTPCGLKAQLPGSGSTTPRALGENLNDGGF